MPCLRLAVLGIFVVLLAALDSTVAQSDHPDDLTALRDLFSATGGAAWSNKTNWLVPNASVCVWFGVTCDALNASAPAQPYRRVIQLDVTSNNMTGTLPSSMGLLSQLERILLQKNQLFGAVPASIGNCSRLVHLRLSQNKFSGEIPPSICNLSRLAYLSLRTNELSGTIPECIGSRLTQLTYLGLYQNLLVGSLPNSLSLLSRLDTLDLGSNALNGSIPSSIGSLNRLRYLYLNTNKLSGSIPSSVGALVLLQELWLYSNQLSNQIPDTIGALRLLQSLNFRNNMMSGTIPLSLCDLGRLQYLSLRVNALSGSVPEQMGRLTNLTTLQLGSNLLSGSLPRSIRQLKLLTALDVSSNSLSGDFDILDATFFPAIVNASFNRFGPTLARFENHPAVAGADAETYALVDIRVSTDATNGFLCPYPENFPPSVVLLRTPCQQPWSQLGIYAGILAAAVVTLAMVYLLIRHARVCSVESIKTGVWVLQSVSGVAALAVDILTLVLILHYLISGTNSCTALNRFATFQPVITGWAGQPVLAPSQPFTDWLKAYMAFGGVAKDDPAVVLQLTKFSAHCDMLPECGVDALGTSCDQVHPERAETGGAKFTAFLAFVIAIAAIRGVLELVRLGFVAASWWRRSLVEHWMGADLARSSFASPLLYFAVADWNDFFRRVALYEAKRRDMWFRLVHAGLLSSIGMLAANLYFLLRVTQVGMSAVNWLALVNGMVLVPRVFVSIALVWWRKRGDVGGDDGEPHKGGLQMQDLASAPPSGENKLVYSTDDGVSSPIEANSSVFSSDKP